MRPEGRKRRKREAGESRSACPLVEPEQVRIEPDLSALPAHGEDCVRRWVEVSSGDGAVPPGIDSG